MMLATEILTAWIKADPQTTDIDRLIGMSAYMAKKLEQDMLKPIEQLEAEVWPQAEPDDSDEAGNAIQTGNGYYDRILAEVESARAIKTTRGEQA